MQAYFQAKMRLFNERLKTDGVAVINTRDPSGIEIASAMRSRSTRVISCGEAGSGADLVVLKRIPHVQGQTLSLSVFGASYEVEAPVAGDFQAANILCALGLAVGTGVPVERAITGIARLSSVSGRLELAAVLANGAAVYVDYAHTPDALDNVLRSLRPHVGAKARLHALFGCGGDRDPGKRPIMGRIAEELSDCVWVTDDNPRTEDPDTIRRQVLSGAAGATNAGPRREALHLALCALRSGDVLVVAGKGHEDYQIVLERDSGGLPLHDSRGRPMTKKIPFSDAKISVRYRVDVASRKWPFYDARGNTICSLARISGFVVFRTLRCQDTQRWARISNAFGRQNVLRSRNGRRKGYRSDGLLVGPFPDENAFALLIVNTDGTLAERSGNGLTIFSVPHRRRTPIARMLSLRVYRDLKFALSSSDRSR
jgi:hypothetical protein